MIIPRSTRLLGLLLVFVLTVRAQARIAVEPMMVNEAAKAGESITVPISIQGTGAIYDGDYEVELLVHQADLVTTPDGQWRPINYREFASFDFRARFAKDIIYCDVEIPADANGIYQGAIVIRVMPSRKVRGVDLCYEFVVPVLVLIQGHDSDSGQLVSKKEGAGEEQSPAVRHCSEIELPVQTKKTTKHDPDSLVKVTSQIRIASQRPCTALIADGQNMIVRSIDPHSWEAGIAGCKTMELLTSVPVRLVSSVHSTSDLVGGQFESELKMKKAYVDFCVSGQGLTRKQYSVEANGAFAKATIQVIPTRDRGGYANEPNN